jgi:hypothetical protein
VASLREVKIMVNRMLQILVNWDVMEMTGEKRSCSKRARIYTYTFCCLNRKRYPLVLMGNISKPTARS